MMVVDLPSQLFTPQSSSTEKSQEEDDYIGDMAEYMLPDEDKLEKTWDLSGSPESTLGSNLDSLIGASREPLTPMVENFEKARYNQAIQQQQQQQQLAGSHMRAVFFNASGSRNGSCGTGVFLPRGIGGTPTVSRKKQESATVLIVVQALKLHFEKTGVPTRPNSSCFPLQHDACVSGWNNSMHSQYKGPSRNESTSRMDILI
ncbi:hypothetical protein V6N12_052470 [Hibiscus sabdariffa]|uniref:Uncharacterized protein n=1 Tax=Hibiscus sabdariffa TaxID=183260 RepID=A0ABR2C1L7_9ROSI